MNKQLTKGFTIIEVVLVLAIAGLIFLMVFIALPALQAGQRDQARRSDASTVASQVSTYGSNNRGAFPTTAQLTPYVEDEISNNYDTTQGGWLSSSATYVSELTGIEEGEMFVVKGATCGASSPTSQALTRGSANQFVVVTWLEAGDGTAYCLES